ncbi:MAG: hypothetical protein IKZ34_04185 [Alphaproteobacteria bacterium]|nr:hypothetical protein [Alphaproteobacteria bacterium]
MTNGIGKIIVLVGLCGACWYMAYRLGVSNCREGIATETNKVQQMVQESDRNIREKVLSAPHSANLAFLLSKFKRAD